MFDESFDFVVRYCSECDEEYQLPEDRTHCVICGCELEEEE